jgi:L-iditol 2-dehydrogenase
VDEPAPEIPAGGLVVRAEACGLCSGELMEWYMERKVPHVLGHEVSGVVEQSDDPRFPVGSRVFPHHHAPCLACDACRLAQFVHCPQWRRSKLNPGGMAERFGVGADNLNDTLTVQDLRPVDAALIEPLACVVKGIRATREDPRERRSAVIGLGVMGLMHMLLLPEGSVGYEMVEARRKWAEALGFDARFPEAAEPADVVYVCPGSEAALRLALDIVRPGGTVLLFAPMPPASPVSLDLEDLYFREVRLVPSYSCGPNDTRQAAEHLGAGHVRAEQVVSHFVTLDELPEAYLAMKRGEILKAMVLFEEVR